MAKSKVGDTVRFLNDVGGGVISRIINSSMVAVEDDDGFEIPVLMSELVVVEPNSTSIQTQTPPKIQAQPTQQVQRKITDTVPTKLPIIPVSERKKNEYQVVLAFVPVNTTRPHECDAELYLVNDSDFELMYLLSKNLENNKVQLLAKGDLEANTKEHLKLIALADLHQHQTYTFSLIFYKKVNHSIMQPQQINIDLNPIKFVRPSSFTSNDFFDQPAYIYTLVASKQTEELPIDVAKLAISMTTKNQENCSPKLPVTNNNEIKEIDLHIDLIEPNYKKMSNEEIFEVQKNYFIKNLDQGIQNNTKRMVFIHGVGNGRLKLAIRHLLSSQYNTKLRYQDASFKEYGYGATMVML